jgi:hypothetical protein
LWNCLTATSRSSSSSRARQTLAVARDRRVRPAGSGPPARERPWDSRAGPLPATATCRNDEEPADVGNRRSQPVPSEITGSCVQNPPRGYPYG